MAQVTVEGTGTPCAGVLPRGARATVEVTDLLRKWVAVGCVKVVDGSLNGDVAIPDRAHADDQPKPEEPSENSQVGGVAVAAPARNASRDKWATFLTGQGIAFRDGDPEGDDWDGRDDLIRLWDAHRGG